MSGYAIVHLVAQESFKGLIGPQVVDHMAWHASHRNNGGPSRIVVGLLEPVRVALQSRFRAQLSELRRRSPEVRVVALPYVSRFSRRTNSRIIAARIRRETAELPVVFHCRGESAVEWALTIRERFPKTAIVMDVRGPWPDELLASRGFDGPDEADRASRDDYEGALRRLQNLISDADEVLSVSQGMLSWLLEIGADAARLTYVPCCVSGVDHHAAQRERARQRLGVKDECVLAYVGIIKPYQHVEGGAIRFVERALRNWPHVHLLVLTPDVEQARGILDASEIPDSSCTVLSLPQKEVGSVLAAADAGFLLRKPSRLTRVVQPVKLGEYLSAGVPVIVSRGAGVVDQMIEGADAGVVTDFGLGDTRHECSEVDRVLAIFAARGAELRDNAKLLCARELVWDAHGAKVQAVYRRALQVNGASGRGDDA
jgi:glycosyltransferase involved in cell wall biosynthesis